MLVTGSQDITMINYNERSSLSLLENRITMAEHGKVEEEKLEINGEKEDEEIEEVEATTEGPKKKKKRKKKKKTGKFCNLKCSINVQIDMPCFHEPSPYTFYCLYITQNIFNTICMDAVTV